MPVSYKKRWKLLANKDTKKNELEQQAKVSYYNPNSCIDFPNNCSLISMGFSRPKWKKTGAVQSVHCGDAP